MSFADTTPDTPNVITLRPEAFDEHSVEDQ